MPIHKAMLRQMFTKTMLAITKQNNKHKEK